MILPWDICLCIGACIAAAAWMAFEVWRAPFVADDHPWADPLDLGDFPWLPPETRP